MREKFKREAIPDQVEAVRVPLKGETVTVREPLLTSAQVKERFGFEYHSLMATIDVPVRAEKSVDLEGVKTETKYKTFFAFRAEPIVRAIIVPALTAHNAKLGGGLTTTHANSIELLDEKTLIALAERQPGTEVDHSDPAQHLDTGHVSPWMPKAFGTEEGPKWFDAEDNFVSGEHFVISGAEDGTMEVQDISVNGTTVIMADQESVQVVYQ